MYCHNAGSTTTAFTTATTSTSILRVSATGAIATGTFVLTCTDNIAVNGAAGAVTFDIVSTKDTTALTGQTGYTIMNAAVLPTSAATETSLKSGQAPGDLVFTLGITTALANVYT